MQPPPGGHSLGGGISLPTARLGYNIHMRNSTDGECEYRGCTYSIYAKRLCRSHYLQQRKGHELRPAHTRLSDFRDPCSLAFCDRPRVGDSLVCKSHWNVARIHHISIERLIELSDHGCDACGAPGKVEVDHSHSCPKCGDSNYSCGLCVRGALCRSCNAILSFLERGFDSPAVNRMLKALSSYLERTSIRI